MTFLEIILYAIVIGVGVMFCIIGFHSLFILQKAIELFEDKPSVLRFPTSIGIFTILAVTGITFILISFHHLFVIITLIPFTPVIYVLWLVMFLSYVIRMSYLCVKITRSFNISKKETSHDPSPPYI